MIRVRYSMRGINVLCPPNSERRGTITGESPDGMYLCVLWDGAKFPESLFKVYLELLPDIPALPKTDTNISPLTVECPPLATLEWMRGLR